MASSKKTQNVVGSRQHKWTIKFRVPQCYIRNTQTLTSEKVFRGSKKYGYLCDMSNFKVHPKNLLLSSPLWHPIFWSFSLSPSFPCFIHTLSSSFTCFHSHFLSPSLLLLSILFLWDLILSTLPMNHRVFMNYCHNPWSFSALKSR